MMCTTEMGLKRYEKIAGGEGKPERIGSVTQFKARVVLTQPEAASEVASRSA